MDRHELQRNCPEMRETLGTSFVSRKWKVEQSFGQDRNRTTHEIPREGEFRYPARREKRRAPKKQTAHGQRLPSRWTLKTRTAATRHIFIPQSDCRISRVRRVDRYGVIRSLDRSSTSTASLSRSPSTTKSRSRRMHSTSPSTGIGRSIVPHST